MEEGADGESGAGAPARSARSAGDAPPPPAPAGPRGPRRPLGDRLGRLLRRRPLRYYALEHDFHILPVQVSHSRRARRAIVVVLALLVVLSAWYWVIPRSDARLTVQYHEGLFNSIDVDARVVNQGTVPLNALRLELVVTVDGTGEAVGSSNASRTVPPHSSLEVDAVAFKGDQITTDYRISVTARYAGPDGPVVRTYDFVTEEPFMNQYFEAPLP